MTATTEPPPPWLSSRTGIKHITYTLGIVILTFSIGFSGYRAFLINSVNLPDNGNYNNISTTINTNCQAIFDLYITEALLPVFIVLVAAIAGYIFSMPGSSESILPSTQNPNTLEKNFIKFVMILLLSMLLLTIYSVAVYFIQLKNSRLLIAPAITDDPNVSRYNKLVPLIVANTKSSYYLLVTGMLAPVYKSVIAVVLSYVFATKSKPFIKKLFASNRNTEYQGSGKH